MMDDLVSREDVIKAVRGEEKRQMDAIGEHALHIVDMLFVEDAIKKVPAVDRKRGRWVKARGSWCTPGGDPVWECSECGKGTHVYGIEHGSYGADISDGQWIACPNCGAKMDGE